jgi:hypothetical protein
MSFLFQAVHTASDAGSIRVNQAYFPGSNYALEGLYSLVLMHDI